MAEKVIIIGASGHGKVVADIVLKNGNEVVGFLDDNPSLGETFAGFPVLGKCMDAVKYPNCSFLIAIGNANVREKLSTALDVQWTKAIHPAAVISSIGVEIGEGTVVMANAVINSDAKIGKHCIINTASVVEHDNVIDDYAHISVGAKVAGTVHVGRKTWVGIGASVSNNLTICDDVMIGAGAAVVKDISASGTYVGVPARRVK